MVFSSSIFLFIYLPIVLLIYYLLPKGKNFFLLIASVVFYGWGEPDFLWIILLSILLNYTGGLALGELDRRNTSSTARMIALAVTVALNLGLLFYYKYLDFTITTVNSVFGISIPLQHIVLPIGISFFTFQGMSYVIDLYRKEVEVQKNPINVALYITMFMQLIAGPIVYYKDINEQLLVRSHTLEKFSNGISRFACGLAKKILLANTLGQVADQIFGMPYMQNTQLTAWLGVVSYAFQIYFDFSGYSDMAIGLGYMFGFELKENFNYPYISRSITEFWRRWHISLSTWFRNYVYIPIGGNRRGNQYFNLVTVFLLTGLWHGASWNFVLWGLWFGVFLILEKVLIKRKLLHKIPPFIGWAVSMLIVAIGWVPFRSETLEYSIGYLGIMFGFIKPQNVGYAAAWYVNRKVLAALFIGAVAALPVRDWVEKRLLSHPTLAFGLRTAWSISMLLFGVMACMTSTYNPFIYFRF